MKIHDICVGERYVARVSGNLTVVRVLAVREAATWRGTARQVIDVVNERTGRRLTFRSAARLRFPARTEARTEA